MFAFFHSLASTFSFYPFLYLSLSSPFFPIFLSTYFTLCWKFIGCSVRNIFPEIIVAFFLSIITCFSFRSLYNRVSDIPRLCIFYARQSFVNLNQLVSIKPYDKFYWNIHSHILRLNWRFSIQLKMSLINVCAIYLREIFANAIIFA